MSPAAYPMDLDLTVLIATAALLHFVCPAVVYKQSTVGVSELGGQGTHSSQPLQDGSKVQRKACFWCDSWTCTYAKYWCPNLLCLIAGGWQEEACGAP